MASSNGCHGFTIRQVAGATIAALLAAAPLQSAFAQALPVLGSAASYAVLSGAAVTCTGATLTGDVGSSIPGGPVVQSNCMINGEVRLGDPLAAAAWSDFLAAYAMLAALPPTQCDAVLTGTLDAVSLPPGTYCFDAAATLSGLLTLDGPPEGTWLFRVGTGGSGALTGTGFSVVLAGGAQASNVAWWVADAVTMTSSNVQGSILAGAAITSTGGSLVGRDLAKAGVTLTGTAVTATSLAGAVPPPVVDPAVVAPPVVLPPGVVAPPAVLTSPSLGLASSFQVLSGAAVTLTGSTVNGDAGTFAPNGAVTQTGSPVTGAIHAGDAVALAASSDFLAAFGALAALPPGQCDAFVSGTLANVTLPPGTYCFDAAATLTGLLTLEGPGSGAWIFRIGTSGFGAMTGTGFTVAMAGGASACNVTWMVTDAVTMTSSDLQGNVLAGAAITSTGGSLIGRGLAKAGVTLTGTAVSACTP